MGGCKRNFSHAGGNGSKFVDVSGSTAGITDIKTGVRKTGAGGKDVDREDVNGNKNGTKHGQQTQTIVSA